MELKNPEIRYLDDMREVLYDKEWAKNAPNFEVYYMYRGVKKNQKLETPSLRYDITIIPPRMLGKEFVKTKGHEHIGNYGELYKVLSGEGIFLMQKEKNGKIEDAYFVKAKKGDFILIPSDYGHVTINPSKKNLKIGNWVSKKCKSDYKSIERKRGLCYYYTKSGWLKNINYKKIPKLRVEKSQKSMPNFK
ncbi:glucose-6-phosphate isomerase [Patescibacteria group bacterium]|nr:glucose-6-phosphate isomerase [Patescibacteria group bacterium]MBU4481276.1 glucose-6-phosphate isomerase [Patescibacteria group bacterium]